MSRARELGAFLRERRARVSPAEAGLTETGERRTPGLRREEVAALANVSVGYYIRLEQGFAGHPSTSVVAALATALRLTDDERAHLLALSGAEPGEFPEHEDASPGAHRVLNLLQPRAAALILGRVGDVLAWNAAAAALFPDRFTGTVRTNNVRYVFEHPGSRQLFVDWPDVADDVVAHLRAAAGHRPADPALRNLVASLSATSPEFAARWSRGDVAAQMTGQRRLNHPRAGRFIVDFQVLGIGGTTDQWLIVYSTKAGAVPSAGPTAGTPHHR